MHPIGARTANQTFGNLYTTKCSEMFTINDNKKPRARATHESLKLPTLLSRDPSRVYPVLGPWSPSAAVLVQVEMRNLSMNGIYLSREPEDHDDPLKVSLSKRLKAQIPRITSGRSDTVSFVLTLASLIVSSKEDDEVLVFSKDTSSRFRLGPRALDNSPPIVAFFAPRAIAEQLAIGDHVNANSNIGIPLPPLHLLVSVIVAEGSSNDVDQCMSYLLSLSSYRPASYEQHGLVVCEKDFTIVSVGLEYRRTWSKVPWNHPSAIQKLCAYVKLIHDEAVRPHHPAVPMLKDVITMKTRTIGLYSAILGGRRFRLLPILSRGDGRKPFVALGITEDDQVVRVLKYSWYKTAGRWQEYRLLQKLRDAPGIVRLDDELSEASLEINAVDSSGLDKDSLLRYLTQEKNVLHRDVSWSNILIRPKEYCDLHETGVVKVANRRFVSDNEHCIPHNYRFVSDIFDEDKWKVRVALADFDHATIVHTGEEDDLMVKAVSNNVTEYSKYILLTWAGQGTPMFMAEDVLSVRDGSIMTPFSRFSENVRREVPNDCVDKYFDCQEKHEWDKYYENFAELRWRIEPTLNNDDKLVQSFRHGAVHDAESVFYLCLLFFGRLWPFDEHVDPSEIPTLEADRAKLLEIFAGRRCDKNTVRFVFPDRTSFGTGEKFEPFYAMLKTMFSYVRIPWYNVVATGRGERYEFHLHDFMQRLILKEIRRLRANGDPILIEENPLPVKTSYNLTTYSHDAYLSSSLLCSRDGDESNGRMGYRKDASPVYGRRECSTSRRIFTARVRRTREGKEKNRKRRRNRNDLVNSSSPNNLVLPVDRPNEMPESDKEKLHDPTGTFWDIYWWKARERLWVTAER
ncbi:hypothetical protein A7U60_g1309 [Sanghuangporus baumii]|uniref:Uncharacterized protein n=1 Tax=Sanghuangporus baumii TaxID=108892 RepID=A0A9Q5I4L1_SANBA|nr:hypothetical protein A7U60_g1309 [Sanghuangporus baumii]